MNLSAPLRVGMIRYLNCLPFHFELEKLAKEKGLSVSFLESHPADLNRAMAKGEIDLAPFSSIEYLTHQDDYLLLPDLAIGAGNFVRSVILFSREPLASLNGATIALSEESFSSVILLRILLKRRFGLDNIFVTVAQDPLRALKDHKAALMIGDAALFFESDNWIYKYDLGEMWKAWTGAPFVFSLWAVRRVFATENPREVRTFCDLLKQNLERNLRDPEVLLRNALGVTPVEKRSARMLGYFENLRYGLDREMIEGLSRFYALAFEEKLAPEPRPLEFFR